MRWNLVIGLAMALAAAVFAAGCPKRVGTGGTPGGNAAAGSHAHSHSEESLGPAGGHLIELGLEEYHVEWTHDDDSGLLTFIVRDQDAKEEVPIAPDGIEIDLAVTDEQGKEHQETFHPEGVDVKAGKTARFTIQDETLLKKLTANPKAKAQITVKIGDPPTPFVSQIEHHAHGHSHSHD